MKGRLRFAFKNTSYWSFLDNNILLSKRYFENINVRKNTNGPMMDIFVVKFYIFQFLSLQIFDFLKQYSYRKVYIYVYVDENKD